MAKVEVSTLFCGGGGGIGKKELNRNSCCDSVPDTLNLHRPLNPPIIIKQEPTTPTLFTFLPSFSSFSVKQEPQEFDEQENINNNSVSPIHAVPIRQYNPPDHLCLHLSLSTSPSSCPSCSTATDHPLPFKKRKHQQTQNKNKKARLNVNDDHVVAGIGNPTSSSPLCLHLSLGTPTCSCNHHHHTTNKTKRAEQETNSKTKNVDHDAQWEIKKVLKGSDISANLGRLLLNRDVAYDFVIPVLGVGAAEAAHQKDGVQVQVWDVDKQSLHSLAFKIWPSAQSHVFTKTWIKDFVVRRELKERDEIDIRWDPINQRFDFSVLKRVNN